MIELDVPFDEKDEAKALGAQWDIYARKWTITADQVQDFERWLPYVPTPVDRLTDLPPLDAEPAHIAMVKKLAQSCEYPEWMLLMLAHDKWAALWKDDLDGPAASAVVAGDYEAGCRFVGSTPGAALSYMRQNRLYTGWLQQVNDAPTRKPEAEDDSLPVCLGELKIGDKSITIQLPYRCETLIQHVPENSPIPAASSGLANAIYNYLLQNTPDSVKYPDPNRLNLARTISTKIRVPLPLEAESNMALCEDFIEQHKTDYSLYRGIFNLHASGNKFVAKKVNDYVKWDRARTMLRNGSPWEIIAEAVGVKTQPTIEKYANSATAAEEEHPELLTSQFYRDLVVIGRRGDSVENALEFYADELAFEEFKRERLIRSMLKDL